MKKKHTVATIQTMKRQGEKIACLTAYDASFAALLDQAGIEIILVGDSLGMVLQGENNTLNVSMANMIYHSQMVATGRNDALLIVDMPYMSYATPAQALGNAARLLGEGKAEVVKMEGGQGLVPTIALLTEKGIPVCTHLGLQPQFIHQLGNYGVQGTTPEAAEQIKADALALEQAGAVMLTLECVPATLAKEIAASLEIPVIGIGAGVECDGQVLVLYDLLGISQRPKKISKVFLDDNHPIADAITDYITAVKSSTFPAAEHSY